MIIVDVLVHNHTRRMNHGGLECLNIHTRSNKLSSWPINYLELQLILWTYILMTHCVEQSMHQIIHMQDNGTPLLAMEEKVPSEAQLD